MTARRIARIRTHAWIVAAMSLLAGVVWLALDSGDLLFFASMATAYTATVCVLATLSVNPLRTLSGATGGAVSLDVRRDLGFWAAALSFAHVAFGIQRHFKGRWWLYFVPEQWEVFPVRLDAFGSANWLGLAATLIVLVLLLVSNDVSLRRLGARRWKRIQSLTQPAAILILAHGFAYQVIVSRPMRFVLLLSALTATGIALRVAQRRVAARWRPETAGSD